MKKVLMALIFFAAVGTSSFAKQKYPSEEKLQAMDPVEKNKFFPIAYKGKISKAHGEAIVSFIEKYKDKNSTLDPYTVLEDANEVSKYWGIDVDYLIAIIRKESSFCQRATREEIISGRKYKSYGVCQIIGYDVKGKNAYGALDAYMSHGGDGKYYWSNITADAKPNMYVACFYLRYLWKYHNSIVNTEDLLGAYNAGPSGCNIDAAKKYSRSVLKYTNELKAMY